MSSMDNYIFVGSFENRWKYFNYQYQLKTKSSWVLVSYNAKYDNLLEEHIMFDEKNDERITINREITITDFEKQVCECYTKFIVNNIQLLRK